MSDYSKVAKERVTVLFSEAEKNSAKHPELSKRHIELARKISSKFKVRLTKDQKMKFCRKCGTYLIAGKNARIRIIKGKIALTCLDCGYIRRFVYKK